MPSLLFYFLSDLASHEVRLATVHACELLGLHERESTKVQQELFVPLDVRQIVDTRVSRFKVPCLVIVGELGGARLRRPSIFLLT